ncbi:MAG: hypothetical protein ABID38_06405 [Candidatus Diapherotrites archaeon]
MSPYNPFRAREVLKKTVQEKLPEAIRKRKEAEKKAEKRVTHQPRK